MALSKSASKLKSAMAGSDYEDEESPESSPAAGPEELLDELWDALKAGDKEGFGKALHEYVLACSEGDMGGASGLTVVKI